MTDDAVQRFAESIAGEVEEGLTADMPFSAGVFTRLVLERLEDAGHLDGSFDLHQEGRLGNAAYRIDGFAFDEERFRLDLFTTLYLGDPQPDRIPAGDANRAFERALRFASACVDGLASHLEPSNTDASDLARRIEGEASALTAVWSVSTTLIQSGVGV
jgi:hypothetical protein